MCAGCGGRSYEEHKEDTRMLIMMGVFVPTEWREENERGPIGAEWRERFDRSRGGQRGRVGTPWNKSIIIVSTMYM